MTDSNQYIPDNSSDYALACKLVTSHMNESETWACVRHVEAMAYCESRIAETLRKADWLTASNVDLHEQAIEACKGRLDTILARANKRLFEVA